MFLKNKQTINELLRKKRKQVQLCLSRRADWLPRALKGHSQPSLVLTGEVCPFSLEWAADQGLAGWGFVRDCKLFGSAFLCVCVAVPALGRAPVKSRKLGVLLLALPG